MPGLAQPQQRPAAGNGHGHGGGAGAPQSAGAIAYVGFLGTLYCLTSAGLIAYNKYLINEKRFPYAVPLVLTHTIFCTLFASFLLCIKPSLFPSITDPVKKISIDADLIFRGALPIAAFFTVQLVLSNTAYLHSSVAFLQMLKEANLVLIYVFSLTAGLEKFCWRSVKFLFCILVATTMTIHGELNFSVRGFAIQGTSQFFECSKIVLQSLLLSAAGRKLDALTYVLVVMPLCMILLTIVLLALVYLWPNDHLAIPGWGEIWAWSPHLVTNAMVAFCLNVVIALFIKSCGAVAFILAGIVKDAMIVSAGVMLLHEIISPLQTVGFIFQLLFIFAFSMYKEMSKQHPEKFEDGLVVGFYSVLFGGEGRSNTALMQKGQQAGGDQEYGTTDPHAALEESLAQRRPNISQK